jgi:proteic killer suppression protein
VIKNFRSKGLTELWATGKSSRIDARLHARIPLRLDTLDAIETPADMNRPGYDFHELRGFDPTRYTVHVNGPWCITFAFDEGSAIAVDFEQYH